MTASLTYGLEDGLSIVAEVWWKLLGSAGFFLNPPHWSQIRWWRLLKLEGGSSEDPYLIV
jgi:hypothetical protein